MKGRALVIGAWHAADEGRSPADANSERLQALLVNRDFEVHLLTGPDATRDGILAAYTDLIESVVEDEAVVIYFSGHGGIVRDVPAADELDADPERPRLLG